jgi:hypothetical protein
VYKAEDGRYTLSINPSHTRSAMKKGKGGVYKVKDPRYTLSINPPHTRYAMSVYRSTVNVLSAFLSSRPEVLPREDHLRVTFDCVDRPTAKSAACLFAAALHGVLGGFSWGEHVEVLVETRRAWDQPHVKVVVPDRDSRAAVLELVQQLARESRP